MAEQKGKPRIGRSARLLGIRPGIDVDLEEVSKTWLNDQGYLRSEVERNTIGITHVSIMPRVSMLLEKYETALANTQNEWKKVN